MNASSPVAAMIAAFAPRGITDNHSRTIHFSFSENTSLPKLTTRYMPPCKRTIYGNIGNLAPVADTKPPVCRSRLHCFTIQSYHGHLASGGVLEVPPASCGFVGGTAACPRVHWRWVRCSINAIASVGFACSVMLVLLMLMIQAGCSKSAPPILSPDGRHVAILHFALQGALADDYAIVDLRARWMPWPENVYRGLGSWDFKHDKPFDPEVRWIDNSHLSIRFLDDVPARKGGAARQRVQPKLVPFKSCVSPRPTDPLADRRRYRKLTGAGTYPLGNLR